MDITLTIAVIGASISVIGWIVNYILSTSAERRRQNLITQIEFTKQQLEELYGPLAFLVMEGRHSFSEAMQTITDFFVESTDNPERQDFIRGSEIVNKDNTFTLKEDSLVDVKTDMDDSNLVVSYNEDEKEIWKYWIENEFFPRNEKIKNLLASKTHLIEGEKIPNSWVEFITHSNSWRIHFERWKKGKTKYPQYSKTRYPKEFSDDVITTFQLLKKRQVYLMGLVGRKESN